MAALHPMFADPKVAAKFIPDPYKQYASEVAARGKAGTDRAMAELAGAQARATARARQLGAEREMAPRIARMGFTGAANTGGSRREQEMWDEWFRSMEGVVGSYLPALGRAENYAVDFADFLRQLARQQIQAQGRGGGGGGRRRRSGGGGSSNGGAPSGPPTAAVQGAPAPMMPVVGPPPSYRPGVSISQMGGAPGYRPRSSRAGSPY